MNWSYIYQTNLKVRENRFPSDEMITPRQLQTVHINLHYRMQITDRAEKLGLISNLIGRPVLTTLELTRNEASALIELLFNDHFIQEHKHHEQTGA